MWSLETIQAVNKKACELALHGIPISKAWAACGVNSDTGPKKEPERNEKPKKGEK